MEFFKATRWKIIFAVLLVIPIYFLENLLLGLCSQIKMTSMNPGLYPPDGTVPLPTPFYCSAVSAINLRFGRIIGLSLNLTVLPLSYLVACTLVFLVAKLKK